MSDAITDEGVARLRARIGVAHPHPQPPHYLFPNEDAFRHVARAYGDDNPLWCDSDYAKRTRWGGPIAPPHLVGGDTQVGEDEVTALDPETIKEVLSVMRELAVEGITMVVVTHEMGFAREVADRVIFLDEGRIVEMGTPQVLFDRPKEHRTRDFLAMIL